MPSTWVEYPDFRRYEMTRQEANNSLMAMLAGSQLAAHTLQLTQGSSQLLPEIFPGVDGIGYFRLRTDAATDLLKDVGPHLGAVAVPYILAVHEDFVRATLDLLERMGRTVSAPGKNGDPTRNRVDAWNMHEAFYMTAKIPSPARGSGSSLEVFHLLREMRNCRIHAGGRVSERLKAVVANMSTGAKTDWERLAHRSPSDVIASGVVQFTKFDIFAVLAVTKLVGREINSALTSHFSLSEWADIVVGDYREVSSKQERSDAWGRGLVGHGELLYPVPHMSERDLFEAASRAGLWPTGRSVPERRAKRGRRRLRDSGSRKVQM